MHGQRLWRQMARLQMTCIRRTRGGFRGSVGRVSFPEDQKLTQGVRRNPKFKNAGLALRCSSPSVAMPCLAHQGWNFHHRLGDRPQGPHEPRECSAWAELKSGSGPSRSCREVHSRHSQQLLLTKAWLYMILISVTLAVAAIPEGIPLCVTISLRLDWLRIRGGGKSGNAWA